MSTIASNIKLLFSVNLDTVKETELNKGKEIELSKVDEANDEES